MSEKYYEKSNFDLKNCEQILPKLRMKLIDQRGEKMVLFDNQINKNRNDAGSFSFSPPHFLKKTNST